MLTSVDVKFISIVSGSSGDKGLFRSAKYTPTRRCGSVYLGVVVLRVCEICYVYEGYVGFAVVVYAMVLFEMRGAN